MRNKARKSEIATRIKKVRAMRVANTSRQLTLSLYAQKSEAAVLDAERTDCICSE